MAPIPQNVSEILSDFVHKISKQIPVKKAILFGSYAKGMNKPDSDVDVAIFSDYFENLSRVEGIAFLLMNAMEYPIDLEPLAFTEKEYEERLGIVEEIIRTGIDIPVHREEA
jgi:predicted nucleotidyltransferase